MLKSIIEWRNDYTTRPTGEICIKKKYGDFLCVCDPIVKVHLILPVFYEHVIFDENGEPSLVPFSEPYHIKKWIRGLKSLNCLFSWDTKTKFIGARMFSCCVDNSKLLTRANFRLQIFKRMRTERRMNFE